MGWKDALRQRVTVEAGRATLVFLAPDPASRKESEIQAGVESMPAWLERIRPWLLQPDRLVDFLVDGERPKDLPENWREEIAADLLCFDEDVIAIYTEVAFRRATKDGEELYKGLAGLVARREAGPEGAEPDLDERGGVSGESSTVSVAG